MLSRSMKLVRSRHGREEDLPVPPQHVPRRLLAREPYFFLQLLPPFFCFLFFFRAAFSVSIREAYPFQPQNEAHCIRRR